MFAFSNVLHLFTDELSRLCGRRLSFARVTPRTLECLSFRHSEPPNQGLHKSVPFGHHSEPAGGPLLEMTGSARKIPVVHYRLLTQLPSGPLWCLEKTGREIQGSSTATGNCGSTSDHYRGASNATETMALRLPLRGPCLAQKRQL